MKTHLYFGVFSAMFVMFVSCAKQAAEPEKTVSSESKHLSTRDVTFQPRGVPGAISSFQLAADGSLVANYAGFKIKLVAYPLPSLPFIEGEMCSADIVGPANVEQITGSAFSIKIWIADVPTGFLIDSDKYRAAIDLYWFSLDIGKPISAPRMADYLKPSYGPWYEDITYGQLIRTSTSPTTIAVAPPTFKPATRLPD